MIRNSLLTLCLLLMINTLCAQLSEWVSTLTAIKDPNSNHLMLKWEADATATSYELFRKNIDDPDFSSIANIDLNATSYIDTDTDIGDHLEYALVKNTASGAVYALLNSGHSVAPVTYRGHMLLLVDDTHAQALTDKTNRWISDLEGDGWIVSKQNIARTMTVVEVKDVIRKAYDDSDIRSVFLLGHIPVPYSGHIVPDGHTNNHYGAWPADIYYADMDETWTDIEDHPTSTQPVRTQNVAGDGKFDQDTIYASELEVGRVDFFNMPAFAESELELLEKYLDKNHAFRQRHFKAKMKAVTIDNFNRGFELGTHLNFPPLVGHENLFEQDYRSSLQNDSYILSFAAGPGSYVSAGSVSNTVNMAADSLQGVFTTLFGSYFGDWDSSNNFLRSALGSGTILTNCWGVRPLWRYFHMGMGETIGYCTRVTQSDDGVYISDGFDGGIHVALMGDPSLRMHMVQPAVDLFAQQVDRDIQLNWGFQSNDDDVFGFMVYRKAENEEQFTLIEQIDDLITETFDTNIPGVGKYTYMVRSLKLEHTPSGSFFNQGTGVQFEVNFELDDFDEDGFSIPEDCNDNDAAINPDAIEIANNDIDEDCDGIALIIDEDMDGFNSDEDCDDADANVNPDATEIANNDIDEDCDGVIWIIDEDMDGFNSDEDCDDLNPTINPDAIEIANNDVDEDCDGNIWIIDEDMDGFNSDEDCDDTDANVNPDAIEIANNDIDEDCDGMIWIIDNDNDGFNSDEDCDDDNDLINPDAPELCDMIDNNCNGTTDENLNFVTYYFDGDMDGYGDTNNSLDDCTPPAGYSLEPGDCDDSNADLNPGNQEIPYNGIDDDCDLNTADDDLDGDGYGIADDCDDQNSMINPGAQEIPYNGLDDDCNPASLDDDLDQDGYPLESDCNDNDSSLYLNAPCDDQDICTDDDVIDENCNCLGTFKDTDGDGFCNAEDCRPNNPSFYPGAPELCDGFDNDCDGEIDNGLTFITYYVDVDEDGFGAPGSAFTDCQELNGYVQNDDDCDDLNTAINPDAIEIPNNDIDENCDGIIEIIDIDGDGINSDEDCDDNNATIYPGAEEICDHLDNNCDGTIDEGLTLMIYYVDGDMDGYGDGDNLVVDCVQPPGTSTEPNDCNDQDSNIFPGNTETPYNGIDDDCDPLTLDDDLDQDGFGISEDCDDENANIYPGAPEIPENDIDEDCNGSDWVITDIEEVEQFSISVFPNPTNGFFFIEKETQENLNLEVINLQGQLIQSKKIAKNKTEIDISNLNAGLYVLKISNLEGKTELVKLVKN